MASVLVLGYGNPGRQDDGLGPAAAEAIEALRLPGVTTSAGYQLAIEDASDAAEHDAVVFVDAARTGAEPFSLAAVEPSDAASAFVSHVVQPAFLLGVCRRVYGRSPRATLVGIRGYAFEFAEGLTERAQANLALAVAHITATLLQPAPRP